jgi:chromate transporter
VRNGVDASVAIAGFVLLERWRVPPIAIVVLCILASLAVAMAT